MKVIVASKNPVKIKSSQLGFEDVFRDEECIVSGLTVASGVSDQPMSEEETYRGAKNRCEAARRLDPEADFWIGIEGGVAARDDTLDAFAWIYVQSKELVGSSRTASFSLPPKIVQLVKGGMELGHADDLVFQRHNSKQNNGAVGILTHDLIDRVQYYRHAIIMALIPFKNTHLYR